MEIVEDLKVKIPVTVMVNLLHAASDGLVAEDPHNEVEISVDEFAFFSGLVMRCLVHYPDARVKAWAVDELEHFWREVDHDGEPITNPG